VRGKGKGIGKGVKRQKTGSGGDGADQVEASEEIRRNIANAQGHQDGDAANAANPQRTQDGDAAHIAAQDRRPRQQARSDAYE
jgi:hypothetical protein